MDKLYALLVGIDAYQLPLRALTGCRNDVAAMQEFLTGRIPTERLSLKVLVDQEATRQGIIDAFRAHFKQAGPSDTALFYYAGHGSQELTPDLYRDLEPDGLDETLIAYDSRLPDGSGWDLADKELRVLIAEAAERGPHVVVILDSCHSGGATREAEDAVVRQVPRTYRKRPAETFWFASAKDVELPKETGETSSWDILPSGRHVLLAACQDHETAKEYDAPNGRRGAFSYFLVKTLEQLGGDARYRDVHKRVQALVCNARDNQLPQAEGDLEAVLFDGSMPARPPVFHVQSWRDSGWRLDGGEIHAVRKGTELAVYREGALERSPNSDRLATVVVTETGPSESLVEVKQGSLPDEPGALPALVTKLPFPPLGVGLDPDADSEELRRAITASPYLALREVSEASVVVELGPQGLRLRRAGSLRELAPPCPAGPMGARRMSEALVKIARWEAIAGLSNPTDSLAGALRMTVFEWRAPVTNGGAPQVIELPEGKEMRISYGGGKAGRFTVRVENQSPQGLYFALVALDESFGIKLIQDGWGDLPAGSTLWVRRKDGIPAVVPERFFKQGVTQRRDVLLLLVSEQENTDFNLLEQNGLFTYEENQRGASTPGFMDLLDWCPACRDADAKEDGEMAPPRWSVQSQVIVSERQLGPARSDFERGNRDFVNGIDLGIPNGFRGVARLLSASEAARKLGSFLQPPPAAGVDTYPLALAGGLSVLELTGTDVGTVTARDPLKVFASPDLPDGEVPVVLAFDGRRHWRVGAPGATGFPLVIPQLPQPVDGNVWLLFRSARREAVAPEDDEGLPRPLAA